MNVRYAIEIDAQKPVLTNEELTRRFEVLTQIVEVLEARLAELDGHELIYQGTTDGDKISSVKLP